MYTVGPEDISLIEFCDLCNTPLREQSAVLASGIHHFPNFPIQVHTVLCKNCKFVFQRERFSRNFLSSLYKYDKSFSFENEKVNHTRVRKYKLRRQQFISDALAGQGVSVGSKTNVLDVGGGFGECTEHLVETCNVFLTELTNVAPIRPEIIKIQGFFEEILFETRFDAVILNHVLEHVFSPTSFLVKAHNILKSNGIVVIEVPFELYTPLIFRKTGDWRHVCYFSRSVIEKFLLKTGFRPLETLLTTGYYGDRKLPVIRAIATKSEIHYRPIAFKSGVGDLLVDICNPTALHLAALEQIYRRCS